MTRIVLDARPLSHGQAGGFRTYVRSLTRALCETANGNGAAQTEFLFYVDRPLSPEMTALLPPGASMRVLHPSRLRTDAVYFARQVKRDAPDLIHGTVNYLPPGLPSRIPATCAILDAILLAPRPWETGANGSAHTLTPRQKMMNAYWATLTRTTARRTRRIITISESAKTALMAALRLPADRFRVVHIGLDFVPPTHTPPSDADATRTVLCFMSSDPRKNVEKVFAALSPTSGGWGANGAPPCLRVVCSGPAVAERARVLADKYGVQAEYLVGTTDAQMPDVLARAGVFAWPSHAEGFGLPPLEAMLCGCPVVASSAPSTPEVLGDGNALFVSPDAPASAWADALARLLSDAPLRQTLIARGQARAQSYTCERMGRETRHVWADVLGGGSEAT